VKAALEAQYGLDQPLWRQYTTYLGDLARGDTASLRDDFKPSYHRVDAHWCRGNKPVGFLH